MFYSLLNKAYMSYSTSFSLILTYIFPKYISIVVVFGGKTILKNMSWCFKPVCMVFLSFISTNWTGATSLASSLSSKANT